jgi:osomolarity two-component system sensor histidine kinase SLN1
LVIISKLLAIQVQQWLEYTYYQISALTQKDVIYSPLSSYRAGNNSNAVFASAQNTLEQFISSSDLFVSAKLYNLDLAVMAESDNTQVNISDPVKTFLYPLRQNATVPPQILNFTDSTDERQVYISGPVANSTLPEAPYFLGMTLPVYANASIIIDQPSLSGYLTILVNATTIQQALIGTTTTSSLPGASTNVDFSVVVVQPIYGSVDNGVNNHGYTQINNASDIIAFKAVFTPTVSTLSQNEIYNINASSAIREAILHTVTGVSGSSSGSTGSTDGSATKVRDMNGNTISIGYSTILVDTSTAWTLVVEQPRAKFLEPVNQFTKIIIGVVIGIGAFMLLITFPLAWYFVKPITTLKEATEEITSSRKKKKAEKEDIPPPYFALREPRDNEKYRSSKIKDEDSSAEKNNLALSVVSAHSTAIQLPKQLRYSKKFFKDELTELTEAFNIMTEELDKQYTHLEDRVKLRTKELEASKLEAEAANEAKTVFIANISHELRTPLNGILGMTAIAMDEPDGSRIQDSLKLINRSGELLLHILTELLTYSKNTLKRSKLEKSNFQLLEVVYQVKSIFGKLANDSKINFTVLLKPDFLRKLILYGDSNRIIQILMNLVSNSMKFTPVDGSVDVSFKLVGEYDYSRSVKDNFSKVHVLRNNFNRSLPPAPGVQQRPSISSDGKHSFVRRHILNSSNANSGTDIIKDSDNISITTISTVEYDNAIFRSQFSQMKPLPHTPDSIASDSSFLFNQHNTVQNFSTTRNRTSSTITIDSANILSSKSDIDIGKNFNSTDSSQQNTGSTIDSSITKQKHNLPFVLPPSQSNPHHSLSYQQRKPSISSMSKQEVIKNGKSHKVRQLNKPKTWVLEVKVKDTGPGIEPALQEKVFEPFIQGDQTLSRSYGGTGLGLSICRQLATMMNGTLTLDSTIGVGSIFTFRVPLMQTGEILVNEEEMEEFCDDDFNPKSVHHVKEVNNDSHRGFGNNTGSNGSSSELTTIPDVSENDMPRIEITEANKENKKPSSKIKHSLNLEMPSKTSLFEKPHLVTRSSTGTANSSSIGSDGHHELLNELQHMRILVAEDNMVNQEVIKRMLKLEGFVNITMAANGADAVEFVKESYEKLEMFDLIFMDIQMPKVDGLLATKMIRNNLQFQKPIIALTAFADESNVKECLNAGMSGFLSKPIRRTDLRQIILRFCLINEMVTTPQTFHSEEKKLGYHLGSNANALTSPNSKSSPNEKLDSVLKMQPTSTKPDNNKSTGNLNSSSEFELTK